MFEVGKEVICVKSHIQSDMNGVKKGNKYTLLGISQSKCCKHIVLDIGITPPIGKHNILCVDCNRIYPNKGVWWFSSKYFAPIDNSLSDTTSDELLEDIEQLTQPA